MSHGHGRIGAVVVFLYSWPKPCQSQPQPQMLLMWHTILSVFIVVMETHPPFASPSLPRHLVLPLTPLRHTSGIQYFAKMLPFPIFLLLLFSITILTPSPHVMIGFIRTATLQSYTWSTLPTSIRSFSPQSPLGAIPEPPILVPEVSLGASPTSCGPCPMYTALSNTTIPCSFIHATDDRPTNTAVLFVVLLAMFNCLV